MHHRRVLNKPGVIGEMPDEAVSQIAVAGTEEGDRAVTQRILDFLAGIGILHVADCVELFCGQTYKVRVGKGIGKDVHDDAGVN